MYYFLDIHYLVFLYHLLDKPDDASITFLPHVAKAIQPPSSSPAGILLIALMRSPAQAHMTSGFTDIGVPSLRASPRRSLATREEPKWLSLCRIHK